MNSELQRRQEIQKELVGAEEYSNRNENYAREDPQQTGGCRRASQGSGRWGGGWKAPKLSSEKRK